MAAILQMTFSLIFFSNVNCYILIEISLKFVPSGLKNNDSALVQIMVCWE